MPAGDSGLFYGVRGEGAFVGYSVGLLFVPISGSSRVIRFVLIYVRYDFPCLAFLGLAVSRRAMGSIFRVFGLHDVYGSVYGERSLSG